MGVFHLVHLFVGSSSDVVLSGVCYAHFQQLLHERAKVSRGGSILLVQGISCCPGGGGLELCQGKE